MAKAIKDRPIRIGVIGARRGLNIMQSQVLKTTGFEFVALCDTLQVRLDDALTQNKDITIYNDYDEFLKHDMDAVLLANYFSEHAPFALKALEAGKHVLSECTCNITLAEGVALCRKVEETGLIYMLAENYPYFAVNQEMKHLYEKNEIGKVCYAEGEYNHPMSLDFLANISYGIDHWRFWIPSTYYCTHALAPLMHITNSMPKVVNGFAIPRHDPEKLSLCRSDAASVIMCKMDNGSVFKTIQGFSMAGHSIFYRVHGTKGAMKTEQDASISKKLHIWREEFDVNEGQYVEEMYKTSFRIQPEIANQAGHGGGDFYIMHYFGDAIRNGKQPFFDVYRGVTCSSIGILAWKSVLSNSSSIEVPDFGNESDRKKYENDHWSPLPVNGVKDIGQPPSSIFGDIEPDIRAIEKANKIWQERGYKSS